MKKEYFIAAAIALVVAVAYGLLVGGQSANPVNTVSTALGGVSNFDQLGLASIKVGTNCNSSFGFSNCSGTETNGINYGSCTIWAPSQTISATATQQAVCQSATDGTLASGLTGVTSDSYCEVRMASSTNTTVGGIVIEGTSASSTAGSIVVQIANLTGGTFTWDITASSSAKWKYMCFDPA